MAARRRNQRALDKRELWKEIRRDERQKARSRMRELKAASRGARAVRQETRAATRAACGAARAEARAKARAVCDAGGDRYVEAREAHRRAAGELAAEKQTRRELRAVERSARSREAERKRAAPSAAVRRTESDDEVRSSIDPELLPLWEKVKRSMKATSRRTRLEAFFEYVEAHPDEAIEAQGDPYERAALEMQERAAHANPRKDRTMKARTGRDLSSQLDLHPGIESPSAVYTVSWYDDDEPAREPWREFNTEAEAIAFAKKKAAQPDIGGLVLVHGPARGKNWSPEIGWVAAARPPYYFVRTNPRTSPMSNKHVHRPERRAGWTKKGLRERAKRGTKRQNPPPPPRTKTTATWEFQVGKAIVAVDDRPTTAWRDAGYRYPSVVYFHLSGPRRDMSRAAAIVARLGEVVESREHYVAVAGERDAMLDKLAASRGVKLAPRRNPRVRKEERAKERLRAARRNPGVNDARRHASAFQPFGFVVARDTFLSGWGEAPGTSYYALAVRDAAEARVVADNFRARPEFRNVRVQKSLPRINKARDHLSVADWTVAPRYYIAGEFRKRNPPGNSKRTATRNPRAGEGFVVQLVRGQPPYDNEAWRFSSRADAMDLAQAKARELGLVKMKKGEWEARGSDIVHVYQEDGFREHTLARFGVRAERNKNPRRYGKRAGAYVAEELRARRGKGRRRSKKQAVAIGLARARRAGVKVPKKKNDARFRVQGSRPPRIGWYRTFAEANRAAMDRTAGSPPSWAIVEDTMSGVVVAGYHTDRKTGKPRPDVWARNNPAMTSAEAIKRYRRDHWGQSGKGQVRGARAPNPRAGVLVELGELVEVVYRTRKGLDRKLVDYEHTFKNRRPTLAYNETGLVIVDGDYQVTVRGIVG